MTARSVAVDPGNQRRKAQAIAPFMARTGIHLADVAALPYASRDRSTPTQRSFVRRAYATAYAEATANGRTDYPTDLSEPSGPDSDTWRYAEQLRLWMVTHPGAPLTRNPWYLQVPAWDPSTDRALYGVPPLPTACAARGCRESLKPAATYNPFGPPFTTHPACVVTGPPPAGWRPARSTGRKP